MPFYIIFASAGYSLLRYSIDTEAVGVVLPSPILDTRVAEDGRLLEFEILYQTRKELHGYLFLQGKKDLTAKKVLDKIYHIIYMKYPKWKTLR